MVKGDSKAFAIIGDFSLDQLEGKTPQDLGGNDKAG